MKKIFLLLLCILSYSKYYGQQQSQNLGISRPTPSAASLATYSNIPVSLQTGVPDVSYPLISVSSNSKMVEISFGLNYHTGNISDKSWASNVGKGWSLLGTGIISREILGDFDESFDDTTFHKYQKNAFDDIYNFDIPGESGKFRFIRDTINNTFQLTKLSNYTSKVEYTRNNNTATLIIDSFTITSDTGIKYKFQNHDIAMMTVWRWNHPLEGPKYADKKYRSAFYLTSINDENNQELVKYIYIKDLKYAPGMNQIPETETSKLTRIEIKDRAIIDINTTKDDQYNPKNDNFRINDVVLKTYDNNFIKKYAFQYSYPLPLLSRTLDSFTQVDRNENTLEKYGFYYNEISTGSDTEGVISSTVLKKIQLPTGGTIEYDFDLIPYEFRAETVQHPAPTKPYGSISFDNLNGPKKYFFTVSTVSDITIDASQISNLPQHTWALQFYKKVGNNFQISNSIGPAQEADSEYPSLQTRTFGPGEYYVELFTNDFVFPLKSPAHFSAAIRVGDPFETTVMKFAQGLPRIKRIKYYNIYHTSTSSSNPSTVEDFEYNKFDDLTGSSGYLVSGGSNNGTERLNPVFIYKNVKVSKGGDIGYSKYYFKAPDAYPYNTQTGIWPNFNLTRNGLLEKKEVYNNLNQKLTEDVFEYLFEEYDSPKYLVAPSYVAANFYLKTSWVKSEKILSKTFFDSGIAEIKKELVRNNNNYKTSLERSISFDGDIQETSYQYATEKGNQKLILANMIGIPMESKTIVKKSATGQEKLLSRTEKKFDHANHKLPTSTISYDSQNALSSEISFDQYDSKGNLEQYTNNDGVPVAIVWGYRKTQPIAKIEGAQYSQVAPFVSDIVTKSNADQDVGSEKVFQDALDLFRNNTAFESFQITTYVYDPLIGVKVSTPPSGIRVFYKYDQSGRLERVEDEAGKVLKKYKYNYKN